MALRRLTRELKSIEKSLGEDENSSWSAGPIGNDILKWRATINGPSNTPYENGIFFVDFDIPNDYPFKVLLNAYCLFAGCLLLVCISLHIKPQIENVFTLFIFFLLHSHQKFVFQLKFIM